MGEWKGGAVWWSVWHKQKCLGGNCWVPILVTWDVQSAWGCFVSFHQSLKTTFTCVWKHSGPQHLTGDMEHGKFTRLMTELLSDAMCSENLNRKHAWPCKAWRYVRAPFVGQLGECCPLCWVTLPTLSFRQLSQVGRGGTHCSQMEVNLELTSC